MISWLQSALPMSNDAKYKKPLEDLFRNTKAINEGEIAATLRKENAELERYEEEPRTSFTLTKSKSVSLSEFHFLYSYG